MQRRSFAVFTDDPFKRLMNRVKESPLSPSI